MPKYIIHIGPPKTGSKYIQSQLFHNRGYLETNGVVNPDNWWTRPDQVFHEPVLRLLREGKDDLKSEFAKINAKGCEKVILSCEGFDALTPDEIERLREAIGDNTVDIVYYVRRWSDRIPSDWRQQVMMGQFLAFPEFHVRLLNRPVGTDEINCSCLGTFRGGFWASQLENCFLQPSLGQGSGSICAFLSHNRGPARRSPN